MKYKILLISLLFIACNRNTAKIIYETKTVTYTDTITVKSVKTDTIPCDDFDTEVTDGTDTVYIKVVDKQIQVKYIRKHDTIYMTPTIVNTSPRRVKIDNSNTAKKGGIIGDGNTQDNRKQLAWWWIFLAGGLSMFIVQNVFLKAIKSYI